jgi:hypothetical protein
MSKEKDIFGGFDLFNPTAGRLLTPDPANKLEDDVVTTKTKEDLDRDAATSFDANLEKEAQDKKTQETDKFKQKSEVKAKSTDKVDETKTKDKTDTTVTKEPVEPVEEVEEEFSYKPFISHLRDKGILDISTEDFDKLADDESGLEEATERTIGSKIDQGVDEWKSSYNSEVQELLKFVEMGGKPKDFFDVYYGNTSFEKMKTDSEESQKFIIRQGLKLSGFEDAEAEEELKDYEDLGKLEAKATIHLKKLQAWETQQKKQLIASQEEQTSKQVESNKQYWVNLKEELFKKEDLQGFKVTSKMKEDLWNFISTPDKTGKTGLQKHNEENKDAQFLYAYLAKNNWDITKLEREATTKVTSDLRKNLGKFTDSRQKLGGARDNQKEKVDNTDPFEGFGKLKI